MAEIEVKPKPFGVKAREVAKRIFGHEDAVLAIILVGIVAGFAGLTRGATLRPANVSNLLLQSSIRGVASVGQLFVILTAGIDLSVGGLALMTTMMGASLVTSNMEFSALGYPLPLAAGIVISLLIGLGVGAANGMSVSRLHIPALIVTLAMWSITKGVGQHITGMYPIMDLPPGMAFFGQGFIAGVPVPVCIFVAVAVVAYFVLYYTTFGRSVYAVGGNAISAWLSGINVPRILFMAYLISGFLAGLCAVIIMGRTMCGTINNAAGLELDSIAAVCIGGVSMTGGRGTLIGAVIGVMVLGVMNSGMSIYGMPPEVLSLVRGAIIVTAVAIDIRRRR